MIVRATLGVSCRQAPSCRVILWVAAIVMLLCSSAASAQQADPDELEPYVDRLIDDGNLQPIIGQGGERGISAEGNPRSLIVEVSGSRISPRSRTAGMETGRADNEAGVSVSGRYQTDNHGLLGIDAQLRWGTSRRLFDNNSSEGTSGTITLTSREFPLGNGWLADSAAGMLTADAIPLARRQPRFYIPTSPLLGAKLTLNGYKRSAEMSNVWDLEPGKTFNISAGEPGLLGGLRLTDFSGLSGLSVSSGGQLDVTPALSVGVQAIGVENTSDPYAILLGDSLSGNAGAARISGEAVLGSARYARSGLILQANAIWSHLSSRTSGSSVGESDAGPAASRSSADAAGAWIDASYASGRQNHNGGIYYFDPGLSWGASAIVNNAYGAYYRFSSTSQRWRWTLGLDAVESVNKEGSSGLIASADMRRQLNFITGIGLNGTARVANGKTSSHLLAFVDLANALGSTRLETGWSQDSASDLFHLGWNQSWSLPATLPSGSRLSTQLAYDHRRQSEESLFFRDESLVGRTNSFGAAISAGVSPLAGIGLDATFAFNSNASTSSSAVYGPVDSTGGVLGALSSQQGEAFSATVSATARLSTHWSLLASYTDSRSSLLSRLGLLGPPSSPIGFTPSELEEIRRSSFRLRAGYLTLRYSISAGHRSDAIGAHEYPVGGKGTLSGYVYLDKNANGTKEPTEKGVPGIVVILDGLQAARTDQSGHYRIENIADGSHRITVNADALPLPWSIESAQRSDYQTGYLSTVEIGVRSETRLDVAAIR